MLKDSKHCRKCDRCIREFDHHCRFVNQCVGSRNYKSFFGLVVILSLDSCGMLVYVVMDFWYLGKQYTFNLTQVI